MRSYRRSRKHSKREETHENSTTNRKLETSESHGDINSSSQQSSEQVLQLQGLIGNQAVMRLLGNKTSKSTTHPDNSSQYHMSPMLQRSPIRSGNLIQRDGDEVGDPLSVLQGQSTDLQKRKQVFLTEIEQLKLAQGKEKDKKKRRLLQVRINKLTVRAQRLDYRIQNLTEKMKPLLATQQNVDGVLGQQKVEQGTELEQVKSSSPVAKAKLELEAEKKRKQDEEDKKYKTYAEMEALSLTQLKKYITETPNWQMRSTHTDEQKKNIQDIHAIALESGSLAVLGSFTVDSIVKETGTLTDTLANLRDFVKAVKSDEPFALTKAPDLTTANKRGNALKKLKAGFPDYVLKAAMIEKYFLKLMNNNLIDDVVTYYTTATSKPIFQAEDGADFQAYYHMRTRDGKNPLDYDGTNLSGKVRNFHRFEADALDQLIKNYGEKKVRPLTLILHSAIDHNGAFHRDPNMTDVIENSHINALMIEGGETLAAYQSQITPLAKMYGINNKIDQVMFAGHGGSQIIEMAGTVGDDGSGELEQVEEAIDLKNDKTKADALFDEVLKNMDEDYADDFIGPREEQQKNRRILFNACLTNSNAVEKALSGDTAKAKQEIKDYLKNNASLATYFQTRAKGQNRDVKSMGANASITEFDMIKSTGELDMVSTVDPYVAASKLEYAEHGHEPLGTLRAAMESWAIDEPATVAAMGRRAALGSTSWDDVIIESMYKLIASNKASYDISVLFKAYVKIAHDISSIRQKSHANISDVKWMTTYLPKDLLEPMFGALSGSDEWGTKDHIPLVIYQLWMKYFPGHDILNKGLLTHLKDKFDVKTGRKFIDISYLTGEAVMASLFSTSGGDRTGKRILGLIGLLDSGEAESKKYIRKYRVSESPKISGLPAVPEVPEVPEQDAPRQEVPLVPAVPGRAKVKAISDKRTAVSAIPDLPELPMLPEVKAKKDTVVKAPGRAGRPERAKVAEVPKVEAHFPSKYNFETLLAGTATEAEILDLIK